MIFGPVLRAELLTTARRRRYYALRLILGALMLWMLSVSPIGCDQGGDYQDINVVARQAQEASTLLSALLIWAVLLLTPALTSGVIAEEKQRKTLHYLLASQLGSAEIVIDKFAARLLHVLVLLASALPIQAILALFGGISPTQYLTFFVGAMMTAATLASLSICVSVHVKRPRDALVASYMLALFWALAPLVLGGISSTIMDWTFNPFAWLGVALQLSSPASVMDRLDLFGPVDDLWSRTLITSGAQLLASILLLTLAITRLRPVASRQLGGGVSQTEREPLPPVKTPGEALTLDGEIAVAPSSRRGPRFGLPRMPVPRCGDDPMLWKELFFHRAGCLMRVIGGIFMASILYALGAIFYSFYENFASLGVSNWNHQQLNIGLRVFSGIVYSFLALAVAARAASGISGERESDTWVSLTTTLVSGGEIVRAKILGAIFSVKWPLGIMLFGWALGVLLQGVNIFGFAWCLVLLTVYLFFAAALGTWSSMLSKSSLRAQGLTITALVVLNGGYLLCCIPGLAGSGEGIIIVTAGVTPMHIAMGLATSDDLNSLFFSENSRSFRDAEAAIFAAGVLSLIFYSVSVWALLTATIHKFNEQPTRLLRPRDASSLPPGSSAKPPPLRPPHPENADSARDIVFPDDAPRKDPKPTSADADLDLDLS